jgi:DNA-binding GntR family transcriptional regulator
VSQTAGIGAAESVADAHAALRRTRELLDAKEHAALNLANREFHRAFYPSCGNEFVTSVPDDVGQLSALGAVSAAWSQQPIWQAEFAEHGRILAAVTDQDTDTAAKLTQRHIELSAQRGHGRERLKNLHDFRT